MRLGTSGAAVLRDPHHSLSSLLSPYQHSYECWRRKGKIGEGVVLLSFTAKSTTASIRSDVKTTIIACEGCQYSYDAVRRNTKYCDVCRLVRDLGYVAMATSNCWVCDAEFAPLFPKDEACGKHAYAPLRHGKTECVFCGDTALAVRSDVAVCNICARNPEHRRKLYGSLIKKQAARRADETNGVPVI